MSRQLTSPTQKRTLATIRALGLHCSVKDGEYRVSHPQHGTYYTDNADDAISTAKEVAKQYPPLKEQLQREIANFRVHLLSDKFTGTERVPDRNGAIVEMRKDWISTSDVLRWLDGFESLLR